MEEKNQKKSKKRLAAIISILSFLLISIIISIVIITQKPTSNTEDNELKIQELEDLSLCYINNDDCGKNFTEITTQIQEYIAEQEEASPDNTIRAAFILASLYCYGKRSPETSIEILESKQIDLISDIYKMQYYVSLSQYYRDINNIENERVYLKKAIDLNIDPKQYGSQDMNPLDELKERLNELNHEN